MHDPRVVANFVLEARSLIGKETTQIDLQKLLYFSFESYLVQKRQRLVSGYFEAWTYGPVHPDIYQAFKAYRGKPITAYAQKRDVLRGTFSDLPTLSDQEARRHVLETVSRMSVLSTGQLVNLSHAKGGPWHSIVESATNSVALGLRITDDVILSQRPYSILMREAQSTGDIGVITDDESPLAGNGHS